MFKYQSMAALVLNFRYVMYDQKKDGKIYFEIPHLDDEQQSHH